MLSLTPAGAADVLDISVAALKSLLQRARARVADVSLSDEDLPEPTDEGSAGCRYMAAFTQSDIAGLERLLAEDTALEMTATTTGSSGKETCVPYLSAYAIGSPSAWQMVGLQANGQLGAAGDHRGDDGAYHPFAIVILATTATQIKRISLFADPALFARFDLPGILT